MYLPEIAAGAIIGITGVTGSGKSTLLRLILREFNLPSGSSITIGGIPIDQLQLNLPAEKTGLGATGANPVLWHDSRQYSLPHR